MFASSMPLEISRTHSKATFWFRPKNVAFRKFLFHGFEFRGGIIYDSFKPFEIVKFLNRPLGGIGNVRQSCLVISFELYSLGFLSFTRSIFHFAPHLHRLGGNGG